MRRLRLTTTAHAHVEHLCKPPPDRRLRDRCQAVLLASRGRQRKRIAQALGGQRTTVRLWLQQSQARGVTGVQIHWAPRPAGAPSRDVGAHDPGLGASRPAALGARSSPLDLCRAGPVPGSDHRDRGEAHGPARVLSAPCHPPLSAHVPLSARRPSAATGRARSAGRVNKKAQAGACGWLSPDAARCPLGPTFPTTLGVQGDRPLGGPWENKEQVYGVAALQLVTGPRPPRLLEPPARRPLTPGPRQAPRLPGALAAPLQASARLSPATTSPEVGSTIAHAPGPRGPRVEAI
jgi:hypothetical protein